MSELSTDLILRDVNGPLLTGAVLGHYLYYPARAVFLKNPVTNTLVKLNVGWSWLAFLSPILYGIPLFFQKQYVWGTGCLIVCILTNVTNGFVDKNGFNIVPADIMQIIAILATAMNIATFSLQILLGYKANAYALENYIIKGWPTIEYERENDVGSKISNP